MIHSQKQLLNRFKAQCKRFLNKKRSIDSKLLDVSIKIESNAYIIKFNGKIFVNRLIVLIQFFLLFSSLSSCVFFRFIVYYMENLLSAHPVYGKSAARNQLEIDNNQNHEKYWLLYEKLIFRLHSFHIM